MIDVCICTHNPRENILSLSISSLAEQNVNPELFRVILVDNASDKALSEELLKPLALKGIDTILINEPKPGLQYARIAASRHTNADWVLWIDDDNEIGPNFIRNGIDFIRKHPNLGCFGGKLLLPKSLNPPHWTTPFLPYLGIRDNGDEVLIEQVDRWSMAEPPGAGAWVHREVLNIYVQRSEENEKFFKLGRSGKNGLASCDDSMMMRGAFALGLSNAYNPELILFHHIDKKRFRFIYLMRLMYAYGTSHVLLETTLNCRISIPLYYTTKLNFIKVLLSEGSKAAKKSLAFGVGSVAYHIGYRNELLRQFNLNKNLND